MLIKLPCGQATLRGKASGEIACLVVLHGDKLSVIRSNSLISQRNKLLGRGFKLGDCCSKVRKVNSEVATADFRLEIFKVRVEFRDVVCWLNCPR